MQRPKRELSVKKIDLTLHEVTSHPIFLFLLSVMIGGLICFALGYFSQSSPLSVLFQFGGIVLFVASIFFGLTYFYFFYRPQQINTQNKEVPQCGD